MMAAAMLLPLPVTVADAEAPSEELQRCPVCTELLNQARQIDRILRSVSDRESADKAADELKVLFDRMQGVCCQLETLPVSTPEDARMLSDSMRTLTHIFQSYPKRIMGYCPPENNQTIIHQSNQHTNP